MIENPTQDMRFRGKRCCSGKRLSVHPTGLATTSEGTSNLVATMMKIQQQALLSGLTFAECKDKTSTPQWQSSDFPPLRGGWPRFYASVVVKDPGNDQEEIVVILGGTEWRIPNGLNSVHLLMIGKEDKEWHEGPVMNEVRQDPAAVVCNGSVYAIGGWNGSSALDTMERISITDLIRPSSTSNSTTAWTTLDCRLSAERERCAAVVVHERFIVVAGGWNFDHAVSSVDIVDTASNSQCSVSVGPSLREGRMRFGMAVIGQRIYVVGGYQHCLRRSAVEYLEFDDRLNDTSTSEPSVFQTAMSWQTHKGLFLDITRCDHAVVKVRSCLVIVGGWCQGGVYGWSVEVVDTQRTMIWKLPYIQRGTTCPFKILALSDGILVIGGNKKKAFSEKLSLVDKNSGVFTRMLEMGRVPARDSP